MGVAYIVMMILQLLWKTCVFAFKFIMRLHEKGILIPALILGVGYWCFFSFWNKGKVDGIGIKILAVLISAILLVIIFSIIIRQKKKDGSINQNLRIGRMIPGLVFLTGCCLAYIMWSEENADISLKPQAIIAVIISFILFIILALWQIKKDPTRNNNTPIYSPETHGVVFGRKDKFTI
ncbi:MAG: hypothetical protein FWF92_06530 [Oscillospiraceae bacterium]|nr:hypothetical protein [Oscillospiraceae bacterium]